MTIYEDELLYSWYARYFVKSGCYTYRQVAAELFGNSRVVPSFEMETAGATHNHDPDLHTMKPYYCFLMEQPVKPKSGTRYFRFCPKCVEEDRIRYGETYWNRKHQINIGVCYKHGCRLLDSSVQITGKPSPDLVAAELEPAINETVIEMASEKEVELARYLAKLMDLNVGPQEVALGDFLTSRLNKYLSPRGEAKKISMLYHDFCGYWNGIIDIPKSRLEKLFYGRINILEVAALSIMLGISAEDYKVMKLPFKSAIMLFDEKVMELHKEMGCNKIAKELGVSSATVRISLERKGTVRKKERHCSKGGAKKFDWDNIDSELLPVVTKTVDELWGSDTERPHRITVGAVERKLGLPCKHLSNLPRCMKVIADKQESIQEYWAREITWSVHKINREGMALNWVSIRRLTNIKKENVISAVEYMDNSIKEIVKALL